MIYHAAKNRFQPAAPMSRRAAEEKRESDERSTVWVFVWTLFAFKILTLIATIWAASGSLSSVKLIFATNWFWMFIPAFAISGPLIFHYRMRRVRRRREAIVRAEWMLD